MVNPSGSFSGLFNVYKDLLCFFKEIHTGISHLDGPPGPVKELYAKLLFQIHDLLTQRRLGNMKPFGSPAKMQFLSHSDKIFKVS